MGHYLFSFHGRINRAKLWAFLLIVIAFEIVAIVAAIFAAGLQNISDVSEGKLPATALFTGALPIVCGIIGLGFLALIWATLALAVKRLHDRNKSAWWLLIFYALPFALNVPQQMAVIHAMQEGLANAGQPPGAMATGGPLATILGGVATIISLWAFVELYCLRGTAGDNRYGTDPLAGKS